eukprot:gene1708-13580_t
MWTSNRPPWRAAGRPRACPICGGRGHGFAECASELCSRCGGRGHTPLDCPRSAVGAVPEVYVIRLSYPGESLGLLCRKDDELGGPLAVVGVTPNSPAAAAGVPVAANIVAVNGVAVDSEGALPLTCVVCVARTPSGPSSRRGLAAADVERTSTPTWGRADTTPSAGRGVALPHDRMPWAERYPAGTDGPLPGAAVPAGWGPELGRGRGRGVGRGRGRGRRRSPPRVKTWTDLEGDPPPPGAPPVPIRPPERRVAPDGTAYTRAEFDTYYGDESEERAQGDGPEERANPLESPILREPSDRQSDPAAAPARDNPLRDAAPQMSPDAAAAAQR